MAANARLAERLAEYQRLNERLSIQRTSAIERIIADMDRVRRLADQYSAQVTSAVGLITTARSDYIHLPVEMDPRLAELSRAAVALAKPYMVIPSSLLHAAEKIRSPWLDVRDPLGSMMGLAGLHGISQALKNMPAFGLDLCKLLRHELGDWRETISWQEEILENSGSRRDFYEELGFNLTLTNFPSGGFEEIRDATELRRVPARHRLSKPRAADAKEDASFSRNNEAHDYLQRLETVLRRFIHEQLTKNFGSNWPKKRLDKRRYDEWQEKKAKGQRSGRRDHPLIAYADFTDYEWIICRRDHWKHMFEPYFGRLESVRESFQRLYPIRHDIAHARPITQEDMLLVHVETRRLVDEIGR